VPVQAVGGLSIQQAVECGRRGAPLVVVGAPLVIDGSAFRPADSNLFPTLKKICDDIHGVTPERGDTR
jgi:3-hexulose-6-phosphate synthase/6-phospho-3-hexuloisomerase